MQETERFRHLSESLQLEVATSESGIRETEIAIRSVEGEMLQLKWVVLVLKILELNLMKKKLELEETT